MKITKLGFLIILTTFLFIGGKAQEVLPKTDFKPLKLLLQIKEKEPCFNKPFTILARLENIGETEQLLDERKLWRFYFSWRKVESTDKNKSEKLSEILELSNVKSGATVVKRENWNFVKLKPGEVYEDRIIFSADDKFFDKPGTYIYQVEYWQFIETPSNNISSEKITSSSSLEFTLKDCKTAD